MIPSRIRLTTLAVCAALASSLPPAAQGAGNPPRVPQLAPSGLVANEGQWPAATRFALRRGALDVALEADGLSMRRAGESSGFAVRFGRAAVVRGEGERRGRYHFFVGNDPAGWRTGVRAYDAVRYERVAPGADLVVRQGPQGVQYDLELQPGASPAGIELRCEGLDRVSVADDGALLMQRGDEAIRHTPPVAWQVRADGSRCEVRCGFRTLGRDGFGFWTEPLDEMLPTVIDPQVDYATYLGGSGQESVADVAVDAQGFVYVGGSTSSVDLVPTAPPHGPGLGFYIAKLDPTAPPGASLVFLAVIGGNGTFDFAMDLVVSPDGLSVCLAGATDSIDFPTVTPTPGLQSYHGGQADGFLTCLDAATGSILAYSVLVGGSQLDLANAVVFDSGGHAFLVGEKGDDGNPSIGGDPNTVLHGPRGEGDAFVLVFDRSGALLGSSLIGGAGGDSGTGIELDASGNLYVVGETVNDPSQPAGWFPRVLAGPKTPSGGGGGKGRGGKGGGTTSDRDGFVLRLDAGLGLVFSTLLGGSDVDRLAGLAVDGDQVHVVGVSSSGDFGTISPLIDPGSKLDGSSNAGEQDAIVASLDFGVFVPGSTGPAWLFATYFGGRNGDSAKEVEVDGSGRLIVMGEVQGNGKAFPTKGTPQLKKASVEYRDLFVAVLAPAAGGRSLQYSSLLGSDFWDYAGGLALAPGGEWVVGFRTLGTLYTTPNAVQGPGPWGQDDVYVRVLPSPVGL